MFRSFDGFGAHGGDGELAIATIDLGQASPKWSFARELTDDDERDWDIAMATAAGRVRTVRDSTAGPPAFDQLTIQDVATGPDLAIKALHLSNPHTRPGSEVAVTAIVTNRGLRTPSQTQSILHVGRLVGGAFDELATIPFVFSAPPDQTQSIEVSLLAPPELTTLRAVADAIPGEVDLANNIADVALGVLPPENLTCSEATGSGHLEATLRWSNGEPYDAVRLYRNGRLVAELPGGAESFADASAGPGAHVWSVVGQIQLAESDRRAATCELTIQSSVVITEIMADPLAGGDLEFVEVKNCGAAHADLYTLTDRTGSSTHTGNLGNLRLPSGGVAILTTRTREQFFAEWPGTDASAMIITVPATAWPSLDDARDGVRVLAKTGALYDLVRYELPGGRTGEARTAGVFVAGGGQGGHSLFLESGFVNAGSNDDARPLRPGGAWGWSDIGDAASQAFVSSGGDQGSPGFAPGCD